MPMPPVLVYNADPTELSHLTARTSQSVQATDIFFYIKMHNNMRLTSFSISSTIVKFEY